MSVTRLPRISPKSVVKLGLMAAMVFLVAVNARVIMESLLTAQEIDEKIVSEANPRLNRTALQEAVTILETAQDELTSPSTFVTVESEATGSGVNLRPNR